VVSPLFPPSLEQVCHGYGRPDCCRDPIPWNSARHHRAKLSHSAHRRPLVSLLACVPLKPALRPMVFVSPSPLPRPGCGANLNCRASLWNQQRDDPRTFGELTSLFHSPLVLRNHPTLGVFAILPGSPRYAPKTPSTIGSNLLIMPLRKHKAGSRLALRPKSFEFCYVGGKCEARKSYEIQTIYAIME